MDAAAIADFVVVLLIVADWIAEFSEEVVGNVSNVNGEQSTSSSKKRLDTMTSAIATMISRISR